MIYYTQIINKNIVKEKGKNKKAPNATSEDVAPTAAQDTATKTET